MSKESDQKFDQRVIKKEIEDGISQYKLPSDYFFAICRVNHVDAYNDSIHRHNFYELVWLFEGQGEQLIDLVAYPVQSNQIYLIATGQTHQWKNVTGHGFLIGFSDAVLDSTYRELVLQGANLFMTGDNRPFLQLGPQETPKLKILADLMIKEYHVDTPDWNIIRPLLCAFLYTLTRLGQHNNPLLSHPHYSRLMKLRGLIEEYYCANKSAEFYASQLHISSKHLSEITKSLVGKTVSGMVQERIILEAKRQLSLSAESVKTIAYSLGFDDPSYFSRIFRQSVGQTPNHFRQTIQQNVS